MKIKKRIDTRAVVIAVLSDAETYLSVIIKDNEDKYNNFDRATERLEILECIFYCDDMRKASEMLKEIWREMLGWAIRHVSIVEASKDALQKIQNARYTILDKLYK